MDFVVVVMDRNQWVFLKRVAGCVVSQHVPCIHATTTTLPQVPFYWHLCWAGQNCRPCTTPPFTAISHSQNVGNVRRNVPPLLSDTFNCVYNSKTLDIHLLLSWQPTAVKVKRISTPTRRVSSVKIYVGTEVLESWKKHFEWWPFTEWQMLNHHKIFI